ncbi:MAG: hypothetical protein KDA87_16830, partial [Planctomycetales bacterium]|nr:hypothetical protein [Planctomycetales bacterium]
MNHTMMGCSLSSRQMFRNVVRFFLVGILWLFLCSPMMAQESPSDTFDYARLALPDLAERLSLTDQQRSTVTMLVAQLAEAQTLPVGERTAAIIKIQQQLKDVLTAEQAIELNKLPGQQKLTFNFRDQNWVDVLSWFAKQSGLSLVINDPPPKTFTYSDSKSYSPKEGLDLLNGVLVTHGFTLIRRDNLLICANIANGIPEGLIPDAELEDLDQYGKFELVRVTFPLGAKPVDQVEAEIKPLLGQFGSSVILPTTRKAVVTSSASRMRSIASTIAAIPEPQKEKPPEPPKPKEKEPPSTLEIYSVEGLDAQATLETLEKLVGGVPMTFDPQAKRINAFAKPNQHDAINRYLEQMRQDVQAGKNRSLQSYDVPGFNLERLSQQLSQLAPNASFSFDDKNSKVVVYAEAEQQEIIKQQLETLGAEVKNRTGQTVKIYLLQDGDPVTMSQVLETMFPKAAVSADETSRSVMVRAEPEDHAEIGKLMEQVKANSPQPKQLKFFELTEPLSADSLKALGTLAPEADITTQADQRRLMVYASPEDVTRIQQNLADVAKLSEEIQRSLNVYDVNRQLRQQFDSLRSKLAPELQSIQIVETNDADRMAVVATQAQHLRLTEFLNELQVKFPEVERELRHYPITKLQREKFNSLRSNLAPQLQQVKLVDAGRENELSAMVTAEENEAMETFLTEIRQRFPDEPAQLQIYDVSPEQRQRFVSVLPTADEKIRNVRLVEDPNPRKLIVWATASQHRLLDELLQRLDQADQATQLTLVNYAIKDGNAESIRTVLAELYPNTKIVADQDANRLLVWTDEEEHRQLKLAIQQLDVSPDNKNNSKMVYYRMGDIDARDIQQLVQQLVPGMSMVSDRDSNTIIAWGSEKQHEDLAKALEDFKQQAAADKKSVQVYPCSGRDPNDIRRLLYQVIPRASFVSDEYSGTVIVWGRTEEHQAVEAALAGVLQGDAGKTQSYLVSYSVDGTDADNVINMLQRLVPTGQYVDADRDTKVLAWANQEGHQKIQAVVEQLKQGDPTRATRKLQFITAPANVIEKLQALMEQVTPSATTLPSEPGSLAVWASAEDLQILTSLATSIQTEIASQQLELRPHAVNPTLSAQVREQLQQTFPTIEFVESNDPAKLLIKAKAVDHDAIEQTIASLQELISEPEVTEVRVFPVGQNNNAAIIISALDEKLKQDAILVPDENRHAIICRAPSRLQDKLQAAVESIVTALPEVTKPTAVVYRLQSTSPTMVRDVLVQLVPGTPLAIDNSAKSIVATALPDVHEKIASTIAQMDKPDSQLPLVTKVYRLQHLTADDAEPIIERVLPRMTITYSYRNNTIAATGTAEEQAKLAETVQGLDQPTANQRVTRIFAVQHVSARAVSRTIEDSFANVDATYDYESDTVFISAPESLMPDIIKTVAEMDVQRGVQREGKVYRLEQGDVYSAISSLRTLFEDASFSGDNQSRTLMAAATPEEHVQIAKLIDELNSQTGGNRITRVFAMQHVSARAASRTIEDAFPNVDATWDYDSDSVIVTAPESLAEAIDKLVAELDVQRGEQREAKVYRLTQGNVYAVRSSLQNLFDDAEISADDENQTIMATATPKEHEQIAKLIDELNSDKTNARVTKAFAMQYASARAVSRTIEDSFPNIDSTYDYETDTVIVSAPQALMEAITQTVAQIDVKRANQREAKVYRLEQGDVDAALYSLRALLDDASFSADDENRTILASATSEEHTQIAKLIDELNTPREDGRTTKIYPFRYGDPRAAEDVLQPLLPAAILSADRFSRSLAVTGTAKEHATVASTVAELDKPANTGRTTKVYPFRAGDPVAAQQALQALHNEAVFAVDVKSRTLIVTGTEEEHASVQTAVDKLDSKSEFDATIEAYVVSRADVAAVYTSLQQMFAANSTVSLTMDEVNRTILFKGNAEDHRTVA